MGEIPEVRAGEAGFPGVEVWMVPEQGGSEFCILCGLMTDDSVSLGERTGPISWFHRSPSPVFSISSLGSGLGEKEVVLVNSLCRRWGVPQTQCL